MHLLGFDLNCPVVQAFLSITIASAIALVAFVRFYACVTCGKCSSRQKMENKTVIITGANGGIGTETTRSMAKRGARVIMACRNIETATAIKDEIVKETGNTNIVVKKLDLSSQQSIRDFAADINKNERELHVLIHNAGLALGVKSHESVDGVELTLATNHYGPFLLTHLLIDLLKRTAPSRIVIVASEMYKVCSVNLNKMNPIGYVPAFWLYYVSKYLNIYFARELARRLEGTGVTANSLHPGMIDTGIWRNVPFPFKYPIKLMVRTFFKTPEQGAQTTIHLAVSEELNGVNGKYFVDCKEYELNSAAMDMEKAKKVWEISADTVKLTANDPKI